MWDKCLNLIFQFFIIKFQIAKKYEKNINTFLLKNSNLNKQFYVLYFRKGQEHWRTNQAKLLNTLLLLDGLTWNSYQKNEYVCSNAWVNPFSICYDVVHIFIIIDRYRTHGQRSVRFSMLINNSNSLNIFRYLFVYTLLHWTLNTLTIIRSSLKYLEIHLVTNSNSESPHFDAQNIEMS